MNHDNNVHVIAFTGAARSGKDTAVQGLASYIQDYNELVPFPNNYVVAAEAFAGPLKTMVAALLDFFGKGSIMNHETLEPYIDGEFKEVDIPEIGASPRKLMQTLGTEWGRNIINPQLWVNCMLSRISAYSVAKDHGYAGAFVFITDCRFDNEAAALRELNIPIYRIERDDKESIVDHASEKGVSDEYITGTIQNNGTKIELLVSMIETIDGLPDKPTDDDLHEMNVAAYGEDYKSEIPQEGIDPPNDVEIPEESAG